MEKTQSIDEMTLEKLWGESVTQISPQVRAIIVSALRKARQRSEQSQLSPNRDPSPRIL